MSPPEPTLIIGTTYAAARDACVELGLDPRAHACSLTTAARYLRDRPYLEARVVGPLDRLSSSARAELDEVDDLIAQNEARRA